MLVDAFEKPSAVSVHFGCLQELDSLISSRVQRNEATLAGVLSEQDLFGVVSKALSFPEYFGSNWDALNDCLGDLGWLAPSGVLLILRDANLAWGRNPLALGRLVTSWLEVNEFWLEENRPFHLIFVCE